MAVAQMSLEEGLQEYFGFNKFKGNQEKIIKSLMGAGIRLLLCPPGAESRFVTSCRLL